MNLLCSEKNLKKVIIFYILLHCIVLFIEDRIRYVPEVVSHWEERESGELFVNFIKSLWRTGLSVTVSLTIFWMWFFAKWGYFISLFEMIGVFKKEKIILISLLNSLVPVYTLIFLKFIFIIFFNKNFVSNGLLLLNPGNPLLKFLLSSIEIFKIFEYMLLYIILRQKIKINSFYLILSFIPPFFGENLISFTLAKGG